MADLEPLIRLRKFRVEERQKALADLFRQVELLEGRKRVIFQDLEREEDVAAKSGQVEALVVFAAYASRLMGEVDRINQQLQRLDARVEKAQEDMREAFSEQKKAEIIQERRDEEERARQDEKESRMLDEIGLDVFRRQGEDTGV